jgi:NRAMP (natural resistance-associated macrophage protein)-like metal ion transporter
MSGSMRNKPRRSPVVGPSKPRLWRVLGPGLITGAADDDPSGIATYAQAGAQFGFALSWTLLVTYPLMVSIQEISARIGRTTGLGVAGNIRRVFPSWILQGSVVLLLAANICNIGADLGAMAESSRLLLPQLPTWAYLLAFSLICAGGQVFLQHTRYVAILKWLTLSLFAYFATLFVVHIPWTEFLKGLLVPRFSSDKEFWLTVVAVLGTTISPYLFFWQASQEVEDTKTEPLRQPLRRRPGQGPNALSRIRLDTMVGMAVSNMVALAILGTAAATLHSHGVGQIGSAAQAAAALKPIAGNFAFALFALGIVGTGLLSVPVLAGSAAYALGEARRWPVGLSKQPSQAKAFYAVIAGATLLGAAANTFKINPVKALVWSAALNAIVSAPIMVLIMRIAANKTIMRTFRIRGPLLCLGWAATCVMTVASAAFIVSLIMG